MTPRLARRATIATSAVALLGAAHVPAAHGACLPPVRDGASSVVDCRPTGHEQTFVVPEGVRSLNIGTVGAPGGNGTFSNASGDPGYPGTGGVAVADVAVTPGRTLYVLVGGIGGTRRQGGAGGFNGGGAGGAPTTGGLGGGAGGGGGGASDVRTCSSANRSCDTLASRLVVAAGGGGGAGGGGLFVFPAPGGSALDDGTGGAGGAPRGGHGAKATSGGAGGPGAAAGRLGAGGSGGGGVTAAAGGGGGGGAYGGGGGAVGETVAGGLLPAGYGGGAGSSFGPPGTTFAKSTLRRGFVRITYATPRTANPRPAVRILRPAAGATVAPRGLVVRGLATDASGVRGVALRIERLPRAAGRCTWLDPVTGLGRGRCSGPPSIRATIGSGGTWSYRLASRIALRPGRYRATAYATDESGFYGNASGLAAGTVTFRVRR
jgi:hypothetical protein